MPSLTLWQSGVASSAAVRPDLIDMRLILSGSFLGVHLGYHSSECLMYSLDGAISLQMVGRHPDLGNAQQVTQLWYNLPHELRCLVRHQSSREPEHREELVVQNACCHAHSVVAGDISLGIVCKMVLNHQNILDDWFFLNAHGYLHGHIVDVYQIQGLGTEDGLNGGYMGLGLKYAALLTVVDAQHHPLSHARPPESFSEEAKCAVSTLMTQVMVASIYHCLPLQSWHHKHQDIFVTSFRWNLQIEKIVAEHEVLLAGGVDAAFSIGDFVFHKLVQGPVVIFSPSKPIYH